MPQSRAWTSTQHPTPQCRGPPHPFLGSFTHAAPSRLISVLILVIYMLTMALSPTVVLQFTCFGSNSKPLLSQLPLSILATCKVGVKTHRSDGTWLSLWRESLNYCPSASPSLCGGQSHFLYGLQRAVVGIQGR